MGIYLCPFGSCLQRGKDGGWEGGQERKPRSVLHLPSAEARSDVTPWGGARRPAVRLGGRGGVSKAPDTSLCCPLDTTLISTGYLMEMEKVKEFAWGSQHQQHL